MNETNIGTPRVPNGDPMALKPEKMRGHDEVCKGLGGFLNLWNGMANDDLLEEFQRKIEPVKYYWRGMRIALDEPLPSEDRLRNGFWPMTRIALSEVDQFQVDGTLREEFARDAPHVGRRCDHPGESFCVDRDVYAGYLLAIRPPDEESEQPVWIARAITAPHSDPEHPNSIQIQYWTPAATQSVDAITYKGWDFSSGNSWRENSRYDLIWIHTDCIMGAWHSRIREGSSNPRMRITALQIANIKASIDCFQAQDGVGPSSRAT